MSSNISELMIDTVQKLGLPKDVSALKNSSNKTIEARLLLLQDIARTFEMNYAYFKANSRFTTVQAERIDSFEKLQFASSKTINFIAQHPDELHRASASLGIRIGRINYQPERTLITKNIKSFDIYENREIIGFLNVIQAEIVQIQREIDYLKHNALHEPIESGEYISSDYFIFASTLAVINNFSKDLRELKSKYSSLYSAYHSILNVEGNHIVTLARPTPIFMAIPQYRQIYNCMNAWFRMGVVNLEEERYMISFIKISSLYEAYVLLKIINFIKDNGFCNTNISKLRYTFSTRTFYENTRCPNLYVFEKDNHTVSLYYQPVIYTNDRSEATGISLYRNTTISFPKSLDNDTQSGYYYTPDYLIKIKNKTSSKSQYIIADAKFMTLHNVKEYQVAKLAYKYLFSISSCNLDDEIVSLLIINGQSDKEIDASTDIYDKSISPGNIVPQAQVLTLTENKINNLEEHTKLFRATIGEYLP